MFIIIDIVCLIQKYCSFFSILPMIEHIFSSLCDDNAVIGWFHRGPEGGDHLILSRGCRNVPYRHGVAEETIEVLQTQVQPLIDECQFFPEVKFESFDVAVAAPSALLPGGGSATADEIVTCLISAKEIGEGEHVLSQIEISVGYTLSEL